MTLYSNKITSKGIRLKKQLLEPHDRENMLWWFSNVLIINSERRNILKYGRKKQQ